MGGRREVSIIFYRPMTRSDLKRERSFFHGSVSLFLQLVVAVKTVDSRNSKNSSRKTLVVTGWTSEYGGL